MGSEKVREKPEKGKAAPDSPCTAASAAWRPVMEVTQQGAGANTRSPGFLLKANARGTGWPCSMVACGVAHSHPHVLGHCIDQAEKKALS